MSEDYKQVDSFTDRRGLSVAVGDEVAYAIRSGNTGELKIGVVKEVWLREYTVKRPWMEQGIDRQDWFIMVMAQGGSKPSRLEYPRRIVKVRSNKEIELAEREAELRATPQRIVFKEGPSND